MHWHKTLNAAITGVCSGGQDWFLGLPMILFGLRAWPHLNSGLSPNQLAFETKVTLPANFLSREAKELDGAKLYKKLKHARDHYIYPQAVNHQQNGGEASAVLKSAKFVLVCQACHKPPLSKTYQGPYKVKLQGSSSYVPEGGNSSKDQVASISSPSICKEMKRSQASSLCWDMASQPGSLSYPLRLHQLQLTHHIRRVLPLSSNNPNQTPRRGWSCQVPLGHFQKFNL